MKKFVLMVLTVIAGCFIADLIIKKKSVDEIVDTPDYITDEDYESCVDVNIDVPVE